MLHLKPFNEFSINESAETQEILYALQNTPEGRDLAVLTKWPDWQGEMYEPKRTGRVYSTSFGSKMYMDKNEMGSYCWQALSNGKIFAQGCFPTITECIRDYWAYVATNYLGIGGKAKQEAREILKRGIPVGRGLNLEGIGIEYKNLVGVPQIDINDILNSGTYGVLEELFGGKSHTSGRYLSIEFNPYTPFFDVCDPRVNDLGSKYIRINSNVKGKNTISLSSNGIGINLSVGDPATMQEFFKKCVEKTNVNLPVYLDTNPNSPCAANAKFFFDAMLKSSGDPAVLDSYLESIKLKDPTRYSSAIYALKASGFVPDIIRKHEEENRHIISSGSILSRFRF